MAVDFDVVVVVHACALPGGEYVGRGGKGPQRRLVNTLEGPRSVIQFRQNLWNDWYK
jgi:hypothetical protein